MWAQAAKAAHPERQRYAGNGAALTAWVQYLRNRALCSEQCIVDINTQWSVSSSRWYRGKRCSGRLAESHGCGCEKAGELD